MGYRRTDISGGYGGSEFADNLTEIQQIKRVRVRHGELVDSIQLVWIGADGDLIEGEVHGGEGGFLSTFDLEDGEWIAGVTGRSGEYVDRIEFRTNLGRRFGPYGGDGGEPFAFYDLKLGGLFGRAGLYLDQLGLFTKEE